MKNRFSGPNVPIVLILLAALGSAFLTIGAGAFLYRNTRNVVTAGNWVSHTQEVLTAIQRATLFTERVEASARIYNLSHDEDELDTARLNLTRFNTAVTHLRTLVSDNAGQRVNVDELEMCSAALANELKRVPLERNALRNEGMRCHQALQLMTEQEQQLLQRRSEDSRQKTQFQVATEIVIGAVSLVVFGVLFSLLVRDARMRARAILESAKTNRELSDTVTVMETRAMEARLLAAARHELQLCMTPAQVYRSAASRLAQMLPGTSGAFCVLNNSRNFLESVAHWGSEDHPSVMMDIFDPESCCGLRAGQLRWRRSGDSELDCEHFVGKSPARYLCMPLAASGETLGVLFIDCDQEEAIGMVEARTEGLQQFVQLTAMALAALRLRTKLENQSIRDSLTGLFNRHFMQIAFERELARAARRKNMLAVCMLDVDHFKRFNDQFGHAAGDAALKKVAEVFRAQVRAEDIVCRYGGEGFVIILPEITSEAAYQKAESIRRAIGEVRVEIDKERSVEITISVGVALFPEEGERPEELLRIADKALYRAKHNGRNQVVMAAVETVS